jgi:hypothetical protein
VGKSYDDDYTTRPAPPGSRFVSTTSPGKIALELLTYIRDRADLEGFSDNLLAQ